MRRERPKFRLRCRAISASIGEPATAPPSPQRSPPRHMSSSSISTITGSSPIRWSRGVIGLWDAERGRYTGYVSSQSIHATRDNTARALGVPPSAVRFVAPDVGGGFGAKNFIYPEHVLIPWAAKRVGRPVKWVATRSEVFLSDHQARDHRAEAALALDANGRFLALRVNSAANAGAYLVSAGSVQTFQYVHLPRTVYRIPAIELQISAVLTNTAPIGVTQTALRIGWAYRQATDWHEHRPPGVALK